MVASQLVSKSVQLRYVAVEGAGFGGAGGWVCGDVFSGDGDWLAPEAVIARVLG